MSEVRQTIGIINRRGDVESFIHINVNKCKKDFATNHTNNTN